MNYIKKILVYVCVMLCNTSYLQAKDTADIILINGKIITVDDTFSIQQAVAVQDGRILSVGSNKSIRELAGSNTHVIDLGGKTVIPGLIDTHSHVMRASQYWINEVRFDGVKNRKVALELIKKRAKALKPGELVLNLGGWVEDQFIDDPRGFTLEELDAVAPNNPVFMDVNYSHRYVNSAFLKMVNVPVVNTGPSKDKLDIPGLWTKNKKYSDDMIERDENGRATGRINGGGAGYALAVKYFPVLTHEEGLKSVQKIAYDANKVGLTTIYDGGGFAIQEKSYQLASELAEKDALTMRVFRTHQLLPDTPEKVAAAIKTFKARRPFVGNDHYNLIGIGEVVYIPVHDNFEKSMSTAPEDRQALKDILEAAARNGWNVHLHAVTDESMNFVLDIMDELAENYSLKPLRWLFIHADLITRPTLDRMRTYNMAPSLRSTSLMSGAALKERFFNLYGDKALSHPALRMVQDSGIPWAFGSEAPRINVLKPMMNLAWAVTGTHFYDGEVVMNSTVTREEALIAHTKNGAYQVFQENNLGQIKSGYLADMVVLDRDYLTVDEDELFDITPVMTFVGGKLVYSAGN